MKSALTKDQLKLIAIIIMLLDHIAVMILTPAIQGNTAILTKLHLSMSVAEMLNDVFLSIGSFTGSVMIFFLIEGYFYTRNIKKYFMRLILFAILSQIPFMMAFDHKILNMCFALATCLTAIYVHFHVISEGKRRWILFLLFVINMFTDWSMLAVPFTLFLLDAFTLRDQYPGYSIDVPALKNAWLKCMGYFIILYIISREPLTKALTHVQGVVLAAICITYYYDNLQPCAVDKRSRKPVSFFQKYFFYIFYPVHLIILKLIYINLIG